MQAIVKMARSRSKLGRVVVVSVVTLFSNLLVEQE